MTIGSLFSGIGGLELGLERAGFGPVAWQVEIDPFCRRVLEKHWPEARRFEDARTVGRDCAATVDVLCGGFPCQDVSLAGKRAGLDGARSGLWFEFRRIAEEIEPPIVIVENVPGLRTSGLPRVLRDLADLGFDAEWSDLSAADVGAPHLRRRLFIVATHPHRIKLRSEPGWLSRACREAAALPRDDGARRTPPDPNGPGKSQSGGPFGSVWGRTGDGGWRAPISPIRRVGDGIPHRSHGRRLKALGNAVVPQCAEVIGRALAAEIMKT